VDGYRHTQCTGKGLEYGLNNVMVIFTIKKVDMQGDSAMVGKRFKKFPDQLQIKFTRSTSG
jgi:hypothetical protein